MVATITEDRLVHLHSVVVLKPGQIGWVTDNGGINHNGCYVMGVTPCPLADGTTLLAINLHTGEPVWNRSTTVRPYAEDIELQLCPRRTPPVLR